MKKIVPILLSVSGVGIVVFIVWKLMQPKAAAAPSTSTTASAGPLDSIYKGLGSLFGANKSQDNTGQLITASTQAATSLIGSVQKLFSSSSTGNSATNATPVMSPVSPGLTIGPTPVVDSFDYTTLE
jgi:hypothetical protein